jgi:hypothetical protein
MSASTRTVQQPLGIGQLGAGLIAVALVLIVAAALAFGSMAATKPGVVPAAAPVGAPPAVIDHGWSQASSNTAVGAPPAVIDHGWSEGSSKGATPITAGNGYRGDQGLAPRSTEGAGKAADDLVLRTVLRGPLPRVK